MVGTGGPLEPVSPPTTRIDPFAMIMLEGYHRPFCRESSFAFSCQSLTLALPGEPSGQ